MFISNSTFYLLFFWPWLLYWSLYSKLDIFFSETFLIEWWAHSKFALHWHRTSHLLNNLLAHRQPKSSSLSIFARTFVQFSKIHKKFIYALLRYSKTCILDTDLQTDKSFLLILWVSAMDIINIHIPIAVWILFKFLFKLKLLAFELVYYFYGNPNGAILTCELQGVGHEVTQDLN